MSGGERSPGIEGSAPIRGRLLADVRSHFEADTESWDAVGPADDAFIESEFFDWAVSIGEGSRRVLGERTVRVRFDSSGRTGGEPLVPRSGTVPLPDGTARSPRLGAGHSRGLANPGSPRLDHRGDDTRPRASPGDRPTRGCRRQWGDPQVVLLSQAGISTDSGQEIAETRGWDEFRIDEELYRRRMVLRYLLEHDYTDYQEVVSTLYAFAWDAERVLSGIRDGTYDPAWGNSALSSYSALASDIYLSPPVPTT